MGNAVKGDGVSKCTPEAGYNKLTLCSLPNLRLQDGKYIRFPAAYPLIVCAVSAEQLTACLEAARGSPLLPFHRLYAMLPTVTQTVRGSCLGSPISTPFKATVYWSINPNRITKSCHLER